PAWANVAATLSPNGRGSGWHQPPRREAELVQAIAPSGTGPVGTAFDPGRGRGLVEIPLQGCADHDWTVSGFCSTGRRAIEHQPGRWQRTTGRSRAAGDGLPRRHFSL